MTAKRAPSQTARLQLICLPAVAALLVLLSLALPRADYTQPEWALRAYGRLVDLGHDLAVGYERGGLSGLVPALTAGSSETVDLAGAGPQSYSGKTMLRVTSDVSQRLYLRGCSSGNYTGAAWKPLSDEQYDTMPANLDLQADGQPLFFPIRTQQAASPAQVTVRNLRAPSRYVYAPYGLDPSIGVPENAEFDLDVGLRARSGQRLHTLTYSAPDLAAYQPLTGEAASAELAYRAFVYRNYLDVPADFMERLTPWRETAYQALPGWSMDVTNIPEQFRSQLVTANGWAALMDATTRYDLSAPAPPEDADFVEHFLNESRVGYCMHYATAATLLMRASGIPARYVSGFVVNAKPDYTYVPDSSAHAWMEVYLDGYGWYPVEVTPSSGVESTAVPAAPNEPEQTEPPAPPEPEPEPTAPKPEQTPPGPEGGADAGNSDRILLGWWLLPLAAFAAILTLLLRRTLALKARRTAMDPARPNEAAMAAHAYLHRLLPWGAEPTEQLEQLARKACFSQHTLTPDECAAVLDYVQREAARVYLAQPLHKRLFLRWLRALF